MLIRGQPSSISSFLWAQSGGPTPATGVGMVSAGQLPSHGGELVLAVAAEGWAWGGRPDWQPAVFVNNRKGDCAGGCQLRPVKTNPFAALGGVPQVASAS